MSIPPSDRLLWIAVCIGLAAAYITIPRVLQEIKDAAISPDPELKKKKIQKPAAIESLRDDTLRNLADGHSHGLRNSAIKLSAARAIKPHIKELLLRDLSSTDETRRDNALNGLWLLMYSPALADERLRDHFIDEASFTAVLTALVNVLPLHNREPNPPTSNPELPPSPVRPPNRPPHEVSLLIILTSLLHQQPRNSTFNSSTTSDNLTTALNAGLVTRWLSKYPFPCSLPENSRFNYRKSDIVSLFERKSWASDDTIMFEIMRMLSQSPRALKQLRRAGLRASSYTEDWGFWRDTPPPPRPPTISPGDRNGRRVTTDADDDDNDDDDVRMVNGDETAGMPTSLSVGYWQTYERGEDGNIEEGSSGRRRPRPRSTERSQEEESLRRRHREAIVVADHGAPLRPENILQRGGQHSPILLAPNDEAEGAFTEPLLDPDILSDLEQIFGPDNGIVEGGMLVMPTGGGNSHSTTGAGATETNRRPLEEDLERQLAELQREVDEEMNEAGYVELLGPLERNSFVTAVLEEARESTTAVDAGSARAISDEEQNHEQRRE